MFLLGSFQIYSYVDRSIYLSFDKQIYNAYFDNLGPLLKWNLKRDFKWILEKPFKENSGPNKICYYNPSAVPESKMTRCSTTTTLYNVTS